MKNYAGRVAGLLGIFLGDSEYDPKTFGYRPIRKASGLSNPKHDRHYIRAMSPSMRRVKLAQRGVERRAAKRERGKLLRWLAA